jgi:hypothetical protein
VGARYRREDNNLLPDFLENNCNWRDTVVIERWGLHGHMSHVHWPCIITRAGLPAAEPEERAFLFRPAIFLMREKRVRVGRTNHL